jgi:hypothetical protein
MAQLVALAGAVLGVQAVTETVERQTQVGVVVELEPLAIVVLAGQAL